MSTEEVSAPVANPNDTAVWKTLEEKERAQVFNSFGERVLQNLRAELSRWFTERSEGKLHSEIELGPIAKVICGEFDNMVLVEKTVTVLDSPKKAEPESEDKKELDKVD
jgi:hypothetical protein